MEILQEFSMQDVRICCIKLACKVNYSTVITIPEFSNTASQTIENSKNNICSDVSYDFRLFPSIREKLELLETFFHKSFLSAVLSRGYDYKIVIII